MYVVELKFGNIYEYVTEVNTPYSTGKIYNSLSRYPHEALVFKTRKEAEFISKKLHNPFYKKIKVVKVNKVWETQIFFESSMINYSI